jgi:hypothetical protein
VKGFGFLVFAKKTGFNRTEQGKISGWSMKGFGFLVFAKKTGYNQTELVRFESDFGPVQLIFHKINITRFGWFL